MNEKFLKFVKTAGKLKTLKRTGWVMHKIPEPESVADHSFRLAVMALALAQRFGANEAKVTKMAVLHDLAESKIGDVVTMRGSKTLANQAEKIANERAAMREIAAFAGHESDWTELFDELIANQTLEAKLINQLDRLEAAIQATEYHEQFGFNPTEFLENAATHVHDPELLAVLDELKRQA